ncbi:MAG: hypothetical protein R3B09_21855 [Nannocystaceae bacterium]
MMPRASLVPGLCVFAVLALAGTDAGAVPSSLRPGTKPHYFEFGPTVGYGFHGPLGPAGGAWLDYLYHFKGDAEGPALGVLTTFGAWKHRFAFNVGPMFQWDFKLVPSKALGLYLGPHISAGYAFGAFDGRNYHSFYALVGPTLKLIVNDFWCFWARPLNFDIRYYGAITGNYGAAIGAGITF